MLPSIQELEKYKQRISELEKECDSLKAEIIRNKQQAGKMYQELLERLKKEQENNAKFSPNYFSIGRFIRILEKETLSQFRVRLNNNDAEKNGTLKWAKLEKVLQEVGVTPQDMQNLMSLAGFYEENPNDAIYIGKH